MLSVQPTLFWAAALVIFQLIHPVLSYSFPTVLRNSKSPSASLAPSDPQAPNPMLLRSCSHLLSYVPIHKSKGITVAIFIWESPQTSDHFYTVGNLYWFVVMDNWEYSKLCTNNFRYFVINAPPAIINTLMYPIDVGSENRRYKIIQLNYGTLVYKKYWWSR